MTNIAHLMINKPMKPKRPKLPIDSDVVKARMTASEKISAKRKKGTIK